jgi:hypothetical protein
MFIDFGATGNDLVFLVSHSGCKIEENHSNKQIKIYHKYTGLSGDSMLKMNNPVKIMKYFAFIPLKNKKKIF